MITIEDPHDPRLADYMQLTDAALRNRLETDNGLYMAESFNVIERALRAGHRVRSLLTTPRWVDKFAPLFERYSAQCADASFFIASEELTREVTGFQIHRGAIAAMHRPQLPSMEAVCGGARRILVLEDLTDHTNVGAALRSGAGLGADAVVISPRCADPLYRRAVRVSMGTVFQLPWTRCPTWPVVDALHAQGFAVAALALSDDAIGLHEFCALDVVRGRQHKIAFIVGPEGPGLDQRTIAAADWVVRIDMAHGVDSLNVAAAAALATWAICSPTT